MAPNLIFVTIVTTSGGILLQCTFWHRERKNVACFGQFCLIYFELTHFFTVLNSTVVCQNRQISGMSGAKWQHISVSKSRITI